LGVEDVDHQPNHAARRIELTRLLVRGVGELLDEVLVGVAHHVAGDARVPDGERREVLDQVLEQLVGEALLVGPLAIAENAVEMLLVRGLDAAHGVLERRAHVGRRLANVAPVAALGDLKTVLVSEVFAVLGEHRLVLLVPDVADALEEEERQDVALPVRPVDGTAAQDVGRLPQMRLQLGERDWKREPWLALHRSLRRRFAFAGGMPDVCASIHWSMSARRNRHCPRTLKHGSSAFWAIV
jgi:hypothetical protein